MNQSQKQTVNDLAERIARTYDVTVTPVYTRRDCKPHDLRFKKNIVYFVLHVGMARTGLTALCPIRKQSMFEDWVGEEQIAQLVLRAGNFISLAIKKEMMKELAGE